MENSVINSFIFLIALNIIALILIIFRSDRKMVFKDFKKGFSKGSMRVFLLNAFLMFMFLIPLSIPFSIIQIINHGSDSDF